MGTRHLIAAFHNGEFKVAQYGQFDGYPEGAGEGLRSMVSKMDINLLKEKIDKLKFFSEKELKDLDEEYELDDFLKKYPQLHRETSYEIIQLIYDGVVNKLNNRIEFAANSLFCEWLYILDFDKNTFEVYKGFNETELNETERFYYLEDLAKKENNSKFHPVKFITSFSLNSLPSDFTFLNKITHKLKEDGYYDEI